MNKIMKEEDILSLEDEIDAAVDRLSVEKNRGLPESVLTDPSILESSYEFEKNLDLESLLHPPSMPFTPLESPAIYGEDVERKCSLLIEGEVKARPASQSEAVAPPFLTGLPSKKPIEKMESQLLSLEWEITKENLVKTKKKS